MEEMKTNRVMVDLARGGLVCESCASNSKGQIYLSKGTIKQFLWIAGGDLEKAQRIRFAPYAVKEGLNFLEAFVPYHLGKNPRSLNFLNKIRL
jgi:DNA repair protein RecO (recombination protein O)